MRTGQSWCEPERIQAKQYAVEVAAGSQVVGSQLVEGPYVAEMVPVRVEENYIVVEM